MRATLLLGALELAAGVALGAHGFHGFRREYYHSMMTAGFGGGDPGVMFGFGATMYFAFLVSPRGLLALYLGGEGLLRVAHAAITGEPRGMAVVWLARRAARAVRDWRAARRLRPDRLAPAEGGLLVLETDRLRDWDELTTVEHRSAQYTLRRFETIVEGARRYRYTLGPPPAHHLLRRVVVYPD